MIECFIVAETTWQADQKSSLLATLENMRQGLRPVSISLYDQFHFRVFVGDSALEAYLRHSLWPFVRESTAPKPMFNIYVSPSPLPNEAAERFAAQSRVLLRAENPLIGGSDALSLNPIYIDSETGGQTVSYRFKNDVFVLNADAKKLRADLTRVVKQLLILQFEKSGGFLFHASVVAWNGQAALFVGRSGAGKTTLSLASARAGAHYVSNDRAFLRQNSEGWRVFGWVDPIRVIHTVGQDKRIMPLADYFDGNAHRVVSEPVPLRWVVFPQVTEDAGVPSCTEVAVAEGEERLTQGAMRPYDRTRPAWSGLNADVRFLSLSCRYEEADAAVSLLRETIL